MHCSRKKKSFSFSGILNIKKKLKCHFQHIFFQTIVFQIFNFCYYPPKNNIISCIYILYIFIWKNYPFTTGATTTGVAVVASKICLHIIKLYTVHTKNNLCSYSFLNRAYIIYVFNIINYHKKTQTPNILGSARQTCSQQFIN